MKWIWSESIVYRLITPLHFLKDKLSKRTRSQFECGVTWFCYFDFIPSSIHMYGAVVALGGLFKIGHPRSNGQKNFAQWGGFLKTGQFTWTSYVYHHSHKKRKDSLETWAVFHWILMLTWNFLFVIVSI